MPVSLNMCSYNAGVFNEEWKDAHWIKSSKGTAYNVVPKASVLVERLQGVLRKYSSPNYVADDGTPIITEAVDTACQNQIYLAQRNMLSGKCQTM